MRIPLRYVLNRIEKIGAGMQVNKGRRGIGTVRFPVCSLYVSQHFSLSGGTMVELIKGDILAVFFRYYEWNADIAFFITIAVMALAGGVSFFKHRKEIFNKKALEVSGKKKTAVVLGELGKKGAWFLLFFLFLYYLCFFIEITILSRGAGTRIGVNLQFMGTWQPDLYSQRYMVENILLFFPFGLFFILLWKRSAKIWKLLLFSLLLSLFVEITQFLTGRGYFQVDDIWLNVLGGLLGGDFGLLFWEIISHGT